MDASESQHLGIAVAPSSAVMCASDLNVEDFIEVWSKRDALGLLDEAVYLLAKQQRPDEPFKPSITIPGEVVTRSGPLKDVTTTPQLLKSYHGDERSASEVLHQYTLSLKKLFEDPTFIPSATCVRELHDTLNLQVEGMERSESSMKLNVDENVYHSCRDTMLDDTFVVHTVVNQIVQFVSMSLDTLLPNFVLSPPSSPLQKPLISLSSACDASNSNHLPTLVHRSCEQISPIRVEHEIELDVARHDNQSSKNLSPVQQTSIQSCALAKESLSARNSSSALSVPHQRRFSFDTSVFSRPNSESLLENVIDRPVTRIERSSSSRTTPTSTSTIKHKPFFNKNKGELNSSLSRVFESAEHKWSSLSRSPSFSSNPEKFIANAFKRARAILKDRTAEWSIRCKAMNTIRDICKGQECKNLPGFLSEINSLRQAIATQVSEQRSKVVKAACDLLTSIGALLGRAFQDTVLFILPSLLKRLYVTKKVISSSSDECIRTLLRSTTPFKALTKLINFGKTDSHACVRSSCLLYVVILLSHCSSQDLSAYVQPLADAISKSTVDADQDVRKNVQVLFNKLKINWPTEAQQIFKKLSEQSKRILSIKLHSSDTEKLEGDRPFSSCSK